MKKLMWVIIGLFAYSVATSGQDGIVFYDGSWEETLKEAEKQDKMIFVDCYTSWCGPCKKLAKDIFPQKEVGSLFNESFVSVKIDMEKGEGVKLKEQFKVAAFPTMLFVNSKGEEVHRIVGFRTADKLMVEAKTALEGKGFNSFQVRYEAGERDKEFIYDYISALSSAGKKDELDKVVTSLLMEMEPQLWLKDNNWAMIRRFVKNPHSDIIQYVQKYQHRFIAVHGKRAVEMKLYSAFSGGAGKFLIEEDGVKKMDHVAYSNYLNMLDSLQVKRWQKMKTDADMRYAFQLENWEEHVRLVEQVIQKEGKSLHPQILWNYAMRIDQACPDLATREAAVRWCQIAIEGTKGGRSTTSFEKTMASLKKPMVKKH